MGKITKKNDGQKIEYSLIQGKNSNYEIQVYLLDKSIDKYKTRILKDYQKDITKPGFRKGHVPLDMVEEQVQPYYIWMGILEYAVNDTMKQVLDENKDLKFVGQPYDFNPEALMDETKKGDKKLLIFKIDVYPEVKKLDDKWKKEKMSEVKVKVTKKEIENIIETMSKQYAEYKDTDKIGAKSTARVMIEFNDGKDIIHTKKGYIGENEFKMDKNLEKEMIGKKKEDKIELKYDEKTKIETLHFHPTKDDKKGLSPKTILITIQDIKDMELPKIDDGWVAKNFEKEAGLKTKDELEKTIEKTVIENKEKEELNKMFEGWLKNIKKSFECIIPKYFVDEEYKYRIEDIKKQIGGDKGWEKYLESMGEGKAKAFQDEIKQNVKYSLQNHFILNEVIKELGFEKEIDISKGNIDRELYSKLVGKSLPSEVNLKKEPAKKATKKKTDKKD